MKNTLNSIYRTTGIITLIWLYITMINSYLSFNDYRSVSMNEIFDYIPQNKLSIYNSLTIQENCLGSGIMFTQQSETGGTKARCPKLPFVETPYFLYNEFSLFMDAPGESSHDSIATQR